MCTCFFCLGSSKRSILLQENISSLLVTVGYIKDGSCCTLWLFNKLRNGLGVWKNALWSKLLIDDLPTMPSCREVIKMYSILILLITGPLLIQAGDDSCDVRSEFRLPLTVTPTHYDIQLEPDLDNGKFNGFTNIRVNLQEKTDTIMLHAAELENIEARVASPGKKVDCYLTQPLA